MPEITKPILHEETQLGDDRKVLPISDKVGIYPSNEGHSVDTKYTDSEQDGFEPAEPHAEPAELP